GRYGRRHGLRPRHRSGQARCDLRPPHARAHAFVPAGGIEQGTHGGKELMDTTIWTGRDDSAEGGDTRRLYHIVQCGEEGYGHGDAVLLGFASDAGVLRNHGRPGARKGPLAIRRMLANLPARDLQRFWDAGDVTCEGDGLEAAQSAQALKVARVLDAGARPVTLGGGHEVAWSS